MSDRITPDDAGTWLDGQYGWQNSYRVVDRAEDYGFKVPLDYATALLNYRVNIDLTDTHRDEIIGQGGLAEQATDYLQNLAPEGYSFEWDAGELSLVKISESEI